MSHRMYVCENQGRTSYTLILNIWLFSVSLYKKYIRNIILIFGGKWKPTMENTIYNKRPR